MKQPLTARFIGGVADGRTVPIIGQFMRGKAQPIQQVPITRSDGSFDRYAPLEDRYRLVTVGDRHFYVEETIRDEDVSDLTEKIQ